MSFRSRRDGSHYPVTKKGKTVYKSTNPGGGEISIESPEHARETIDWMTHQWDSAKTSDERIRLVNVADETGSLPIIDVNEYNDSHEDKVPQVAVSQARDIAAMYGQWLITHNMNTVSLTDQASYQKERSKLYDNARAVMAKFYADPTEANRKKAIVAQTAIDDFYKRTKTSPYDDL